MKTESLTVLLCCGRVVPSFRSDKAVNIDKPGFRNYIEKLSKSSGIEIKNLCDMKATFSKRTEYFCKLGCLGRFIGVLTDSRSFVSYTRHEYFRRILCNLLGEWVENGEYPEDYDSLKTIVEGISYYNAKNYFNF